MNDFFACHTGINQTYKTGIKEKTIDVTTKPTTSLVNDTDAFKNINKILLSLTYFSRIPNPMIKRDGVKVLLHYSPWDYTGLSTVKSG